MTNDSEQTAPRQHYLYVNMRDIGCNCGERFRPVTPEDRGAEAREAWFQCHLASLLTPTPEAAR